jgi:3'-phosphoadenosine 5'-phosphosulfate sulfotransferase (PAPS reductase)/FAD synthetase
MPTVIKGQPTSEEVLGRLAEEGKPVLLAFSCGKDSIATWIALEAAGVDVVPAYLWLVPNLAFIDKSIAYFEKVFGKRIARYPHPSFYRLINHAVFQAPERLRVIEAAKLPTPGYGEVWDLVREDLGMEGAWVADGVRAADSIVRRASFVKHGVMKHASKKVSPIADWLKAEVYGAIESRGIELPIDYKIWGRSFDGLDARFTGPMKKSLPEDFERLKEWFPLIEADLVRGES